MRRIIALALAISLIACSQPTPVVEVREIERSVTVVVVQTVEIPVPVLVPITVQVPIILTATPKPTLRATSTPKATVWREVGRWQGKAIKNTETFHIPSAEWRISWKTDLGDVGFGVFQIFIYRATGKASGQFGDVKNLAGLTANVSGADEDWTMMRGAGDYFLQINTSQAYTVCVEALY